MVGVTASVHIIKSYHIIIHSQWSLMRDEYLRGGQVLERDSGQTERGMSTGRPVRGTTSGEGGGRTASMRPPTLCTVCKTNLNHFILSTAVLQLILLPFCSWFHCHCTAILLLDPSALSWSECILMHTLIQVHFHYTCAFLYIPCNRMAVESAVQWLNNGRRMAVEW